MRLLRSVWLGGLTALVTGAIALQAQPAQPPAATAVPEARPDPRVDRIKTAVAADVKSPAMFTFGQQMSDMVFSFAELGFQEYETQTYLTGILEKEGFTIERGMPRRNRASPTAIRSSTAHRGMAKATTPARRSTSSPPSRPSGPWCGSASRARS